MNFENKQNVIQIKESLNLIYTTTKVISKKIIDNYLVEKYHTDDTLGNCLRYYLKEFKKNDWILLKNEFFSIEKRQKLFFIKGTEEISIFLDISNPPGTSIIISRKL